MAYFFAPPPHGFPDRAHRQLLMHPLNLAELVEAAAPAVAPQLVFERAHPCQREFPLPDWRRRANDIFYEVPFRNPQPEGPEEMFVGVLVEHQTKPDQAMPLRSLLYVTGYWDDQWQAWEKLKGKRPPLVLSPVLPIIFHAGPDPWTTHRGLADLFVPPEVFRPYVPTWEPVYWHLYQQPPEWFLNAPGPWLQTMALVRQERADSETFQQTCATVTRGLEALAAKDKLRWHDLMCFLVGWEHYRRDRAELPTLDAVTEASIMNVALREEVRIMGASAKNTLLDWAESHFTALGELRASRVNLRDLLEERFGLLPENVLQRIETSEDLGRLKACIRKVVHLKSLEELSL